MISTGHFHSVVNIGRIVVVFCNNRYNLVSSCVDCLVTNLPILHLFQMSSLSLFSTVHFHGIVNIRLIVVVFCYNRYHLVSSGVDYLLANLQI